MITTLVQLFLKSESIVHRYAQMQNVAICTTFVSILTHNPVNSMSWFVSERLSPALPLVTIPALL